MGTTINNHMRYYQLFEYNSTQTLINYREPLERRLEGDSRAEDVLDTEPTPEAVLRHLEAIDPSKKKAFVLNLLNWYIDGSMRFIEDAYKAKEVFPLYMKFKNRDDVSHISKLSFGEFLELGDRLSDAKSGAELNKEEELVFYESGQAELISDTPEWKVIVPKTKEAAIYFGRNTKWCTSAVNKNMFVHYNKKGQLYIVLFKKENKRYQLHFQTKQYMDERDERASIDELNKIFNGPMKKFQKIAVKNDGHAIEFINNPSEEVKILAVQYSGYAIQHIETPSEEIQKLAVQQDGYAIVHISNPSEEVQRLAVQQIGYAIEYIKDSSEEVQRLAVQQIGHAVYYIKNPSEEIQKLAVQQIGYAIKYIENPSEEIQKLAVQQIGYAIKYIKNPSEEIQKLAVQQDGFAIKYIENPSKEVKRIAAANK